ncbi:STAS-like domain-containing protein [Pseudomonas sp. KCJK8670]|uniref:STAS-like domain-containing protein n=1 Tax=Pseudomonas sp. KCJK8670 TaxID=3344558 RepID=UPI003905DB43
MRIQIFETYGPRCITDTDGQKLHDEVLPHLRDSTDVYLDFTNVRQFASPFFNYSVGQLLNDVTEDELRKFLHLEGLNETGRSVVERVISNASKNKSNNDYRRIVDSILEQQSRGDD